MMDAQTLLRIQGVIAQDDERETLMSGVRQVVTWLERADCAVPKIALTLGPALSNPSLERPNDITIVSLLGAAAVNSGDFDSVAATWRGQILAFTSATDTPLFLCTVFRHVATIIEASDPGALMAQRERIRRINTFIAELSQSTGAFVIDIDSVLAHLGGARLRSDFSLNGKLGVAAAGDVIASALLSEGLHGKAPADGLARAFALHGGRRGVVNRLNQAIAAEDVHAA